MNIRVLHDKMDSVTARQDELDNQEQARAVAEALEVLGHEVVRTEAGLDIPTLARDLEQDRPDLVFNLVEACAGQPRLGHFVPALLESRELRFTGCPAWALLTASDKLRVKRLLHRAGLCTPKWFTLRRLARDAVDPCGTFILKPVHEHGSVGLDIDAVVPVMDRVHLLDALRRRQRETGLEFFAEAYVEGREINVALLERDGRPVALPPAEILFQDFDREFGEQAPRILDYASKWDGQSFAYQHTPRRFRFPESDKELLQRCRELAMECWELLDMRGYARIDLRVDAQGRPQIIDVNPNPCLAPDAGFAAAGLQAGMDYTALVDAVVGAALR